MESNLDLTELFCSQCLSEVPETVLSWECGHLVCCMRVIHSSQLCPMPGCGSWSRREKNWPHQIRQPEEFKSDLGKVYRCPKHPHCSKFKSIFSGLVFDGQILHCSICLREQGIPIFPSSRWSPAYKAIGGFIGGYRRLVTGLAESGMALPLTEDLHSEILCELEVMFRTSYKEIGINPRGWLLSSHPSTGRTIQRIVLAHLGDLMCRLSNDLGGHQTRALLEKMWSVCEIDAESTAPVLLMRNEAVGPSEKAVMNLASKNLPLEFLEFPEEVTFWQEASMLVRRLSGRRKKSKLQKPSRANRHLVWLRVERATQLWKAGLQKSTILRPKNALQLLSLFPRAFDFQLLRKIKKENEPDFRSHYVMPNSSNNLLVGRVNRGWIGIYRSEGSIFGSIWPQRDPFVFFKDSTGRRLLFPRREEILGQIFPWKINWTSRLKRFQGSPTSEYQNLFPKKSEYFWS